VIISNIHCGLGNQLFQYACARRLAHYHKTELKLDLDSFDYNKLRLYGLKHFNISAGIATRQEIEAIQYRQLFGLEKVYRRLTGEKLVNRSRWIKEPHFHFDPKLLTAPNHSYLCGYWQSEKYFIEIRDILLQELTLVQPMSPSAEQYAAQIRSSNAVCVHVRRGDYLKDDNLEVCSIDYYQTAFQKLSYQVSDAKVFIFSDDPDWVKENLDFGAPRIIVIGNSDYEDLTLMSMCKHFIIANSSFSWWGAWLSNDSNKIVYAPKKWFSDGVKPFFQNTLDVIPSSWKTL
jgi:hypothetical protein